MLGTQIGNYKVLSQIGEGGMGTVYLAEHIMLHRKAAIKILSPQYANNNDIRARFKNEAVALAKLEHPNIVKLYDYVETDTMLALIMEYAEGHNLDHYIANVRGPIPEPVALPLFDQILNAFAYAHNMGIVHRDIKPSNIIISADNKVKVLDFGIAKLLDTNHKLTRTGSRMGTVLYMSPELVQGKEADKRSDIYSLGVTLFQIITGKEPYDKTLPEYEVYNNIVHHPLPRIKDIYPAAGKHVQDVIDKATQKDENLRFQSCYDFLNALHPTKITIERVIDPNEFADPVPPPYTGTTNTKPKSTFWRRKLLSLVALLAIVGLGYGVYTWLFAPKNTNYRVLANELKIRNTKSVAADDNVIAKLDYGATVKVLEKDNITDNNGLTWCKVKPNNQANEGYVALNFIMPEEAFEKYSLVFKNANAQELTKVVFKKALFDYFDKNTLFVKESKDGKTTYTTNWGISADNKNSSTNSIAKPDINNDRNEDYVCLLEENTGNKTLLVFTYANIENASLFYSENLGTAKYKLRNLAKGAKVYLGKVESNLFLTEQKLYEPLPTDGFLLMNNQTGIHYLFYLNPQGKLQKIQQ